MEKEIDEIIEEEIRYAETFEYNRSGRAIIEVGIRDFYDFFSPYCVKGDEVIHPEVDNYIMEQATNLSPSKEIEIAVFSETEMSEKSQNIIINAIRRNYADKVAAVNTKLRRNTVFSLALLAVGLVFLSLFIVGHYFDWSFILYSIFDILSWVFCWEAVDIFVLERFQEKVFKKRCIKLIGAEIAFKK